MHSKDIDLGDIITTAVQRVSNNRMTEFINMQQISHISYEHHQRQDDDEEARKP